MLGFAAKQVVVGLIVACGLAHGQTRADFNGAWKMNPTKSDFGSGPVTESRLDRFVIDGIHLKDTITQKLRRGPESTYDMIYTTDGKECANRVRGTLVKSTARWDGEALVVESTVFALRQATMSDRWSISADGRTLTLVRHIRGARQADQTVVFDRQPAP